MSTIPPNLKKEGYPCARNYEIRPNYKQSKNGR